MKYYIDTVDKRNRVLFELLQKEHKSVDEFDLTKNKYQKDDIIVFAPNKKFDEEFISYLPRDVKIFAGNISECNLELLHRKNIEYVNLLDSEIFAIKNANLTCEGVLSLVIQHSANSLYDNNILILGAGRIAKGMAILLDKIGVRYALASFNKELFPQNYTYSKHNYFAYDFIADLGKFDVIINTIPAEIIDENVISKIAKGTIFIETASVHCLDSEKAKDFEYILAPALPQKYTCNSAGKLMFESVLANS